jgi:hypothetical protein
MSGWSEKALKTVCTVHFVGFNIKISITTMHGVSSVKLHDFPFEVFVRKYLFIYLFMFYLATLPSSTEYRSVASNNKKVNQSLYKPGEALRAVGG